MLLATFLVALVAIWIGYKFLAWNRMTTAIDKIGGPKYLPILGNILDVMIPPEELMEYFFNICEDSRSMSHLWLSRFLPYVFLYKAVVVEEVLNSQKLITKSKDYDYLLPWLGTGLLISTGQKWFHRRKMITPAFHFKILEDFSDVFNQKAEILVKKLSKFADGREFDMYDHVALCTLDIILETAMGIDMNVQSNNSSPYVRSVTQMVGIVQERQKLPWLRSDFIFNRTSASTKHNECLKIMHDLSLSTIIERRKIYEQAKKQKQHQPDDYIEGQKKRLPFLDLLLKYSDNDTKMSDEDIREEVDTFMFEGHDTTATAINMTLYLLGNNPDIQAKLHEELDSVLGDDDEPITSEQLKELKYLENCIKESLRLFPSVPIFGRKSAEDVVIGGNVIPADTSIVVFAYKLHRDPKYFPQPEKFDPDRFLPENSLGRHAYAYVPFSAGPRNCIGQKFALMEEKIVLASVMRRFEIKSLESRENLQMMGEIIMRPKNGVRVTLKERKRK